MTRSAAVPAPPLTGVVEGMSDSVVEAWLDALR